MTISSTTAEKLANLNVNLEITANSKFTSTTVEKLVKIVTSKNLHITIHAGNYTSTSLERFAKIGGPNVTIVL
ncbi:hypothetical protein B7760_05820 (plasmid) [Burkholderia glumae]|nr:hypothetical protein B7760_05820 [Burkholderia glumae]